MNYAVHDWMIEELGLKAGKLLVYALVYSYSRDKQGCFFGTVDYIAAMTGMKRRNTLYVLDELVEEGYLEKGSGFHNGRATVDYVAVQKLHEGVQNLHNDECKNCTPESAKIALPPTPPLYVDNKDDNEQSSYEDNAHTACLGAREKKCIIFQEEGGAKVSLTPDEHAKLCEEYGAEDAAAAIRYLSLYKVEKTYRSKSDYLAIRRWVVDAVREKAARGIRQGGPSSYDEAHKEKYARTSSRLREANQALREAGVL